MPPKPKKPTAEELREIARAQKRDQLSRELAHGIKSRKILEAKWRKLTMSIKAPELMLELEVAWRNSEHVLDMKDYLISILMDELDEADNQYIANFKSHCDSMNNLYRIFQLRLYELKKQYDKELKFYHDSLKQQVTDIRKKTHEEENFLKTMIHGLEKQDKNLERIDKSEYMSKLDELEQKYLDEIYLRRNKEEMWFEAIWYKYVRHLAGYNQSIANIEKDYQERITKDTTISKIITMQAEKLYNSQILFKTTKDMYNNEQEKLKNIIKDLNDEYDYWHNLFENCKSMYYQDMKTDDKILTIVVVQSNQVINELEKHIKKAEKILTMNAISGKRETRKEKIMPFPKTRPRMKYEYDWGSLKNLSHFWQKCNQADTTRNNINDEYYYLLKENLDLKQTIKKCLNYECNQKMPDIDVYHRKRLYGSQSELFIEKC